MQATGNALTKAVTAAEVGTCGSRTRPARAGHQEALQGSAPNHRAKDSRWVRIGGLVCHMPKFYGFTLISNVEVEIIDEYEPLEEGLDKVTDVRNVSVVEIKLSKD